MSLNQVAVAVPKDKQAPEWISSLEAADLFGIHQRTLDRYVLSGKFPEELFRVKIDGHRQWHRRRCMDYARKVDRQQKNNMRRRVR